MEAYLSEENEKRVQFLSQELEKSPEKLVADLLSTILNVDPQCLKVLDFYASNMNIEKSGALEAFFISSMTREQALVDTLAVPAQGQGLIYFDGEGRQIRGEELFQKLYKIHCDSLREAVKKHAGKTAAKKPIQRYANAS